MTQEALAQKSGVSYRTVTRLEAGSSPSLRVVAAIASALDTSVAALVEESQAAAS